MVVVTVPVLGSLTLLSSEGISARAGRGFTEGK